MAYSTLVYKNMNLPTPIVSRGINPHEAIRQSMFTLCGPVMSTDPALAGNHRLVLLDPTGGSPAFSPISGYKDMAEFVDFLTNLDQGHDYGDVDDSSEDTPEPGSKQEATEGEQTSQKAALEALSDNLSPKVMILDGETVRPVNMTDSEDPHADWYYVLDTTKNGTVEDPILFVLNDGQKQVATDTVPETQQAALNAKIEALTPVLPKILDGDTVRDAVIDDATASNNDWYYKLVLGTHTGTSEDPVEFDLVPEPADDTAERLQRRFDWLFNRLFVIRTGSEFAEMPFLDPVLNDEVTDAAHDTCVRLHKGRISNLCVLELADDADLETYVNGFKPGETACLYFIAEENKPTRAALAPASFSDTAFDGWTKVELNSIVVNDARIKVTADVNGTKHRNVLLDITCC